jgi:hypothetical protein
MAQKRLFCQMMMMMMIASGSVGRPKFKWKDNVKKNIQAMKIVNWKRVEIKGSQLLKRPKLIYSSSA